MNIQTLTKRYRERFVAFNKRIDEIGTDPKQKTKLGKSPNFLKEVLRPILDELPDLLPATVSNRQPIATPCMASIIVSRPALPCWGE